MKEQFLHFSKKHKLFTNESRVLLAVSGGIDSVCMAHLFCSSGIACGIAHCNFSLRASESNADEKFVKKLAEKLSMPFYVKHFDTSTFAEQKGISIQMAARDLRYAWFEELRKKENYHSIAIAHHSNDEAETFFINLIRGTGISGLTGFSKNNNNIIRPLLFANRKQIEAFAEKSKIEYRNDSSNASDKYIRNTIRHHLIPLAEKLNPDFGQTMAKDIKRLSSAEEAALAYVDQIRCSLIQQESNYSRIQIAELKKTKGLSFVLFNILSPFGFSGSIVDDILESFSHTEEKTFISETHYIVKNRSEICIYTKELQQVVQEFFIAETVTEIKEPITLNFSKCKKTEIKSNNHTALLDYSKLVFPLRIRKWQKGDSFIPLGMKGKKKLSDFFTDNKFSYLQKAATWLVCSGEDIVWVVGHRIDERYKVQNQTTLILKIELK